MKIKIKTVLIDFVFFSKISVDPFYQKISKKINRSLLIDYFKQNKTIYNLIMEQNYIFLGENSVLSYFANTYCDLYLSTTSLDEINYGNLFLNLIYSDSVRGQNQIAFLRHRTWTYFAVFAVHYNFKKKYFPY